MLNRAATGGKDAAKDGAGGAVAVGGGQAKLDEGLALVVPVDGAVGDEAEAAAAEGDQDGAGDGAKEGHKKQRGATGWVRNYFHKRKEELHTVVGLESQHNKPPMERDRCWEMRLAIRSFQNLTKDTLKFFFVVTVESENPTRRKSRLRLLPKYTGTFTIDKGETCTPASPIVIFGKKEFRLSYKELEKHHVKVDMWQVSCWTFNKYLGYKTMKLSEIARKDPNIVMMLSRKLTRKQLQEQRQRGRSVADVAQVSVLISLEEIFDFTLECDNWTFELNKNYMDYMGHEKMKDHYMRLTFIMPKNRKSLPGQNQIPGKNSSQTTPFIKKNEVGVFFWPFCGTYVFRGTRSHLINSYFRINVSSTSHAVSDNVEAFRPGFLGGTGGRCLMNLISVLQISVFQGTVKNFRNFAKDKTDSYVIGNLCGNIKAIMKSKSLSKEETDLRVERPQQLAMVATAANLNADERHLVVKVKKCESLPGADVESGLSDPFLRVSWDGSTMTSTVMKQTIRPVFNQSFFFPVRMIKLTNREKKYERDILQCELQRRNIIKIEVWDDDKQTNADYLGGCQVKLSDILNVRGKEKVNMMGRIRKAQDEKGDADEQHEAPKEPEWYMAMQDSRCYDGGRTPLTGSSFHTKQQPVIHFEAFFYPDWEEGLRFQEQQLDNEDDPWPNIRKQWDKDNEGFIEGYKKTFPDSIGARPCTKDIQNLNFAVNLRRFPFEGRNPLTMKDVPLMAFVSPIIIPKNFSFPAFLMHWVHCLTFDASTSQQRTGLLPDGGWKHTEFFLQRRKGAPQDHAVLLCSLLLGCKKDAFVVKGTWGEGKRTVEHVWVMTREEGWVTFWEPCTRQMFHLPHRYKKPERQTKKKKLNKKGSKGKKALENAEIPSAEDALAVVEDALAEKEEEEPDEETGRLDALQWEDEVDDARITREDMSSLPTIGRMPKPKMKAEGKRKVNNGEKERKEMMDLRRAEHVAPMEAMLKSKTLVDWLPYDSIEVVFNDQNLWANRQNHHPACITYDFEGSEDEACTEQDDSKEKKEKKPRWRPLIQPSEDEKKIKDLILNSTISPNVSVHPKLSGTIVEGIRKDLMIEMQQNIELHRSKKGVDTVFDSGAEHLALAEQLGSFLEIHEEWMQIDPDFPEVTKVLKLLEHRKSADELREEERVEDFILKILCPRQWNKKGSPFFQDAADSDQMGRIEYNKDQKEHWNSLRMKIQNFQKKLPNFPTKRGKRFRGFPVHFSTSEPDNIREFLTSDDTYNEFINNEDEDVTYTIECKIFPLLGGVLSVWLYIGVQEVIRDDK